MVIIKPWKNLADLIQKFKLNWYFFLKKTNYWKFFNVIENKLILL